MEMKNFELINMINGLNKFVGKDMITRLMIKREPK